MNAYLVYVNGILAGPDVFSVKPLNSSELGRFLMVSAGAKALKSEVKSVDVFEVRASNTVARYRAEKSDEDSGINTEGDKITAKCQRVETTF